MCGLWAMVGCCNDSMSIERMALEAETLASGRKLIQSGRNKISHAADLGDWGLEPSPKLTWNLKPTAQRLLSTVKRTLHVSLGGG